MSKKFKEISKSICERCHTVNGRKKRNLMTGQIVNENFPCTCDKKQYENFKDIVR